MLIKDFCLKYNIPTNNITVDIINGNKKKPVWDNSSMPMLEVLTREQAQDFNNYSLFLKYANPIKGDKHTKIFCIDFDYYKGDYWNNASEDDLIKCELYGVLKQDNCYYTETKKGRHYYCILNNVPEYTDETDTYYNKDYGIDLICRKNNMWEKKHRNVFGDKLSILNFDSIKDLFILQNSNIEETDINTNPNPNPNSSTNFDSEYEYLINDYFFNEIISVFDLNTFKDFFKFTCICKYLNRIDDWDTKAKKFKKYDRKNNLKIWNSIKGNKYQSILHKIIYKDLKHLEIYKKIKFKPIMKEQPRNYFLEGNYDKLSNHIELNDKENYILQSCQGTGKTTIVKETLNKNTKRKFISIVSRVNLAYSHHNDFEKIGIQTQVYDQPFDNTKKLNFITTIESLPKIEFIFYRYNLDVKSYTIFLDEFQSLLEHLLDSSTIKSRVEVWTYFCDFIKNCYNFYAVDADISDICIEFLKVIRPKYKYIKNNFQHFEGVEAEEIYNEDELIEKCKEDIKNKQKFFICCDSEATSNYLKELINNDEVKIITSKFPMGKGFDLNKINYLIFSPSIIYGLDDLQDRNIYCFYKEHTISPAQMVQQITRCRNIKKLYYFFNKKSYSMPKYDNIEDCANQVIDVEEYGIRRFKYFSKKDEYGELYTTLLIKYLYDKDCYESNKALHFQNFIQKRGFKIIDNGKYDDYRVKEKIIKDVFQKITNDNFNYKSDWVKNANKYLKLKKETDFIYYKEFFINKALLKNHFSIANFFYKDNNIIMKQIIDKECSDFYYQIFKRDVIKVDFLNELKLEYNIKNDDNKKLIIEYDKNKNHIKNYNTYKKLFNVRSKKDFINDEYNTYLMIGDIYKKLFGKVITKKGIKIKSSGKDARIYEFYINDLTIHENLFNFRKKKPEEDKFQDNDSDDECSLDLDLI